MKLEGKSAIVTGGTSGIGLAVARQIVQRGGHVVVVGIDQSRGREVKQHLGSACNFVNADVGDLGSLETAFLAMVAKTGAVDILVNSAGVLGGPRYPESRPEHWDRAIRTNQVGVLNGIQLAVRYMRSTGGGSIVNVASTSGLTPNPIDPIYAMTKAGIVNLTRSLGFMQQEYGIRVNCVCPGLVATPLEANCAELYNESDKQSFLSRRAGRTNNPSLTPEAVGEGILQLIQNDDLNGCSLRLTHGKPAEYIANIAPHRL